MVDPVILGVLASEIRVYSEAVRRSAAQLEEDLRRLAVEALREKVGPVKDDAAPDLVVDVDGRHLVVEVKTVAYGTVERIEAIKRVDPPSRTGLVLVVADRINGPARAAIKREGWGYLDAGSGEIYLRAKGVRIETTVEAITATGDARAVGIVGRAGRAVAYELLCRHFDRDSRPIVTARSKDEFEVARSSTSDAFRALTAADLVTDTGRPVVPQLFWELVKVWAPSDRRWLASVPDPADWDDPHDPVKTTWRLAGLEAAIFHGAPAVGVGEGPVDLYVPGPVLLSIATRRYGVADAVAAAASVAVPAAQQVIRARDDRERMHRGWLVVHPVAAALDLGALGDARSQQILAEWRPRDGEAVWREP